jgi:hypothetical protein
MTQVNIMFLMLLWLFIHTGQAEKLAWPEIADMDFEHVRTLTNKMADLLYINH